MLEAKSAWGTSSISVWYSEILKWGKTSNLLVEREQVEQVQADDRAFLLWGGDDPVEFVVVAFENADVPFELLDVFLFYWKKSGVFVRFSS